MKKVKRCSWPGADVLMADYHDQEWGVPLHDDRKLFEFLVLEGMQAGLSWAIVLRKRENFRKAFARFNPHRVAKFDGRKVRQLLKDAGIIRNRLKIEATLNNAKRFLEIRKEFGTFDKYIWEFTNGKPIRNRFRAMKDIPGRTTISDQMSKDLKKRGFKFVGSTICYAHMQATGMVNDHLMSCFRYRQV